jgi:hypothetical protein
MQAQAAIVEATLCTWIKEDERAASTVQRPGPCAGIRGGGKGCGESWDNLAATSGLSGCNRMRQDADAGTKVSVPAYDVYGIADLMAEMEAIEDEYRTWLDQYPIAFLDPQFEQWLVAKHAAHMQAHLSFESIFS